MKLLLLYTFFSQLHLSAQEVEKKHRININLEDCLSKEENFTTYGMLECTDRAYKEWDNELNSVYKKLMAKLSGNGRSALKTALVKWIAFRDLEFKNIDSIFNLLSGTMYIPMRLNEKMEL
jgi:uncharacterized protein YecT (DUF1311 family)